MNLETQQSSEQGEAPQTGGESASHWHLAFDQDQIAWLRFDHAASRTNVLSCAVLEELDMRIGEIDAAGPIGLVLVSDKANGFVAGADVKEFTSIEREDQAYEHARMAQNILDRLEALSMPTVALIHGFCLGGGTELALACRYRVAADTLDTRIGLPEVRLGIHPGFGGTVRLPPLVGTLPAMEMMLSGRPQSPRAAKRIGLVDHVVPTRHLRKAARSLIATRPAPKRPNLLGRLCQQRLVRPVVANLLRRRVARNARREHYPAPYALIDLWQRQSGEASADLAAEARSMARLLVADTAQNLIRVFFLQERLKGLGRSSQFMATHVHVVGAGTMGGDIAAWCAAQGLNVSLQDRSPERIAPAVRRAHQLFQKRLKDPRRIQAAVDRLMPDHKGLGAKRADVIVEAVFEDLDVKRELFGTLEPHMKPDAILATNTSSIPLDELSHVLSRPERLVGLHFFNPVAKMQLVEVVTTAHTDPEISNAASAFARQIDRLPLPVRSTPGFLVNRLLMPYLLEAVRLLEAGIPGRIIDESAVRFGMPMGPIELADSVGLDVCLSVAEILSERLGGAVPDALRDRVLAGQIGRKSGRGFYQWHKGQATKPRADRHFQPPSDLQDRLILSLLNETARALREGVVDDADRLDAGVVFGTGFAPFRGGPIHYVRHVGASSLRHRLEQLEATYGERFHPDAGWDNLM